MTLTKKLGLIGICVAILITSILIIETRIAYGDVSYQQPGNTNQTGLYKNYNFFATTSPQVLGYGTSTPDLGPINQATSTNIISWFSNGQQDTGAFVIAGASQVTLFCGRQATSTNSGSTNCTYQVQATPGGPWLYANALTQIASTSLNISSTALVNQLTVTSTSTIAASFGEKSLYAVRCIVNIVQDGVGLCSASALW